MEAASGTLKVHLLSIFPELFDSFLSTSLVGKAIERGLLDVTCSNIRDFASPPHYQVDDAPFGGGAGMVMKPEPLCAAIEHSRASLPTAPVILMSAGGPLFTQAKAKALSTLDNLILVAGRYEGVDQRVIDLCVTEELSIGDFVLMGGEVPAMVVIESVLRLRTGVLGNPDSVFEESFGSEMLLEAPHYTRPSEFRGQLVPEALLSGNHARIAAWRKEQSRARTELLRPNLLTRKPDKS